MRLRAPLSPAAVALLLWAVFVGSLLWQSRFRYYIAEWQQPMLVGALVLLLVLAGLELLVSARRRPGAPGSSHGAGLVWDTAVHGLPLFLLLSVGVTELSASPLEAAASVTSSAALARVQNSGRHAAAAAQPGAISELSLLDLYSSPEQLQGQQLEITGRLFRTEGRKMDWLAPGLDEAAVQALLYRYLITCCIADAMPLAVVLDGKLPADLPQQSWVRVRGRLRPQSGDSGVLVLELEDIEACPAPQQPYLSLYSPLLSGGSTAAGSPAPSQQAPPASGDGADELLLNPCNPCDDPAKDFNWPQGDSAN